MTGRPNAVELAVELARLAIRHRGNTAAIAAALQEEREWARFCARHGLPRHTDPATLDEYDRYLLERWGPGSEWAKTRRRRPPPTG